jgi:hypothetical protein
MTNVLVVGVVAVLVAAGKISSLPWIPIVWVSVLVVDAIVLRNVGVSHPPTLLGLPSYVLVVGRIVVLLLMIACLSTIVSDLWRVGSRQAGIVDLIQAMGALVLFWLSFFALKGLCNKRDPTNES